MDADDDAPPGVPEWVVTYGDMMSLLLTFFIMLVSMSELKEDGKLRLMLDSMNERFGMAPGKAGVPGRSIQNSSVYPTISSQGVRSEGGLKKASLERTDPKDQSRGGAHPTVRRISHGEVVTLGGPAAFERQSANPSEALRLEIAILADVMRSLPNRIVVRGHTTAEPLMADAAFEDRWELAFRRAAAVGDCLVENGINPDRLVLNSSADTEPRRRGGPEAQAFNRRVDVFLAESYITPADTENR
ncbi:OmpA/MotB family protein [Stratiformator vulcanicus]|uniref:Motility protein B n=1 Tax=Stratiformator vulcanicus TaxID=2527980 RepID=A0A517R5C9_9PLAN|nr:flagellar motor protein MotB [Stratiformator vulcanicus]QDT39050.1 Motility protein B [Stratiformator vulcanicus]